MDLDSGSGSVSGIWTGSGLSESGYETLNFSTVLDPDRIQQKAWIWLQYIWIRNTGFLPGHAVYIYGTAPYLILYAIV
jgi:hypothetical protein